MVVKTIADAAVHSFPVFGDAPPVRTRVIGNLQNLFAAAQPFGYLLHVTAEREQFVREKEVPVIQLQRLSFGDQLKPRRLEYISEIAVYDGTRNVVARHRRDHPPLLLCFLLIAGERGASCSDHE